MKQAIVFAAFLLAVTHPSFAKTHFTGHVIGHDEKILPDSSLLQGDINPEMLEEVMNVVGLHQDIELKKAKVLNIEASVSHGKRYVLYNPEFISWITKLTKSRWAAMALLAHEVGHHLNGHTLKKGGSRPALELEADEFAGFILHRLGASLEESQEVMKYIARPEITDTHPARASRMLAIQGGWNRAIDNTAIAAKSQSLPSSSGAGN
ncbi:MAG TPA: hypothetical protein VFI06_12540 [Chitinophagaceae bacterium]|nr:hypothetical protein [Chitinophagaceae bacterium]